MKLDSVREIKGHFLQPASTFAVGVATPERKFPSSIALGITYNALKHPVLAVRCYGIRQRVLHTAFVDAISRFAHGEMQVRYLDMPYSYGVVDALPVETNGWFDGLFRKEPPQKRENQERQRPLKIGYSIGHYKITAGTLGCFAKRAGDKKGMYILSNNHVMACSNDAKVGDKIYQPGKHDGGTDKDTVAKLHSFVRLAKEHNKVDGALALIESGIEFDTSSLAEFGQYGGTSDGELEVGMEVRKYGRTTGATRGKVSAIEMDNVRVNYGSAGVLAFDNQIEVKGKQQFSAGGDSGSLVCNSKNQGVGLLFAGGGHGGEHVTYANDLTDVLKGLKCDTVK